MAYVPIRVSNSVLGLMIIFSCQLRRFTESDLTVLTSMGNQIGLGLTNANLHEMVLARSQTDELTGIMNRRYFMEILTLEYERCLALKTPLTLMMLDMDNFKEVNDSYGHLTGDEVLKLVGKRLAASSGQAITWHATAEMNSSFCSRKVSIKWAASLPIELKKQSPVLLSLERNRAI